ncbi:MAG: thiol-activated cytolysin family protein [Clostridia bacterium]|nr:thiol-activated cytolysin family protein [Clostridia bacterium]
MKHKNYINKTIYGFEYNSEQTLIFNYNMERNKEINSDEMTEYNYIVYFRTKQTVGNHSIVIAVPIANLDVTCPGTLLLANSRLLVYENPVSLEKKRGCVIPLFKFSSMTDGGSEVNYINKFDVINGILQDIVYATMVMENIIQYFEMNALPLLKVGAIVGVVMLMKWIIDKIKNKKT